MIKENVKLEELLGGPKYTVREFLEFISFDLVRESRLFYLNKGTDNSSFNNYNSPVRLSEQVDLVDRLCAANLIFKVEVTDKGADFYEIGLGADVYLPTYNFWLFQVDWTYEKNIFGENYGEEVKVEEDYLKCVKLVGSNTLEGVLLAITNALELKRHDYMLGGIYVRDFGAGYKKATPLCSVDGRLVLPWTMDNRGKYQTIETVLSSCKMGIQNLWLVNGISGICETERHFDSFIEDLENELPEGQVIGLEVEEPMSEKRNMIVKSVFDSCKV